MSPAPALSHRDRAILRAVAGGTAQLSVSSEPDLFVDGRNCSDQVAARRLAHAGLIVAAVEARTGQRVLAELSPAGQHQLLLAS
jgi:ribulose 1,5-bisphosphate synthetase/thiazole synthase